MPPGSTKWLLMLVTSAAGRCLMLPRKAISPNCGRPFFVRKNPWFHPVSRALSNPLRGEAVTPSGAPVRPMS